jgi:hypothetical protein
MDVGVMPWFAEIPTFKRCPYPIDLASVDVSLVAYPLMAALSTGWDHGSAQRVSSIIRPFRCMPRCGAGSVCSKTST